MKTWSRGTNSRLPFGVKVNLNLSIAKLTLFLFLFFLVLCCRINTQWLNTMEQWTLSVKRSGEMRDSLRHFLFC